jgi:hypothetical protein
MGRLIAGYDGRRWLNRKDGRAPYRDPRMHRVYWHVRSNLGIYFTRADPPRAPLFGMGMGIAFLPSYATV